MNIVFFSHPDFLGIKSISRYTKMLADGMKQRGHTVEIWIPKDIFYRLPLPRLFKKWLGYADQYFLFPIEVRNRVKRCPADTLFVFADQALGPWVRLVNNRTHVIHCHDFLAQRSAMNEIEENPTGFTGKMYQRFIRNGYSAGENFISVSQKTQQDLHRFLPKSPSMSKVVYNGINNVFAPFNQKQARILFGDKLKLPLSLGYLLHIGGNQWYKNRIGVINIYTSFRKKNNALLPLILVGENPTEDLLKSKASSPFNHDIYFVCDLTDEFIRLAYAGASVFLFPSLAEGFGWPIAEAMACRCPVVTTNEAPMSEVAGNAAFFISRKPFDKDKVNNWADEAASVIDKVLALPEAELQKVLEAGTENAKRFSVEKALDETEQFYEEVLQSSAKKI